QIHALMIFVELIFIFCWLFISAGASSTAAKSVALLMSGPQAWLFWLGVVFFGIVDPLLIYVYEVVLHRPLKAYAMVVSDGSVLVGGVVLRYLVLAAAVPINLV
ncbi:MAG: NrfD/PsrC family molybdoenzyme membrane anchor subunit, partial [Chloroflexota bacterium]